MTLDEIVSQASTIGIDLGKNPSRTIRFYTSKGLLDAPKITYNGKIKQATYSTGHLTKLKLINIYKKRRLTLNAIKKVLDSPIYLSDKAIEYINKVREKENIPDDAFQKDKPITRIEFVYILYFLKEKQNNKYIMGSLKDFIEEAFVNDNGKRLIEVEQLL